MGLGIRLFDRVGKKVLLTEAGDVLYERAITIVDEYEDCKRALSNLDEKVAGRLSFATSHHIGLHRLPPVLQQFNATYPDVDLDIHFMDSEEACRAVISGEIELALVTLPNKTMPELNMMTVWNDPLYPVIKTNHPLMVGKDLKSCDISLEELVTYPVILPGPKTFTFELITNTFSNLGLDLNVKLSSNYLEMIKMLISVGLGWGFLPESMIEGSGLCPIIFDRVRLVRVLGVIAHKQRTVSRSAKEMISMLGTQPLN